MGRWSSEQTEVAVAMRKAGSSFAEIAAAVPGKTAKAVCSALRRAGLEATRRLPMIAATEVTISPDELADRERRYSLRPRDLTAALTGDPLPGYSALDRRR